MAPPSAADAGLVKVFATPCRRAPFAVAGAGV